MWGIFSLAETTGRSYRLTAIAELGEMDAGIGEQERFTALFVMHGANQPLLK